MKMTTYNLIPKHSSKPRRWLAWSHQDLHLEDAAFENWSLWVLAVLLIHIAFWRRLKLHLKRCLQHVHTHPYDSFRSLPLTYPFNDRHRRTASIKSLIQIPIAHNPQIPNYYNCTIAAENAIPNTLIKFQTLSGKSAMRPSQNLTYHHIASVACLVSVAPVNVPTSPCAQPPSGWIPSHQSGDGVAIWLWCLSNHPSMPSFVGTKETDTKWIGRGFLKFHQKGNYVAFFENGSASKWRHLSS